MALPQWLGIETQGDKREYVRGQWLSWSLVSLLWGWYIINDCENERLLVQNYPESSIKKGQ
jgi:hypothetical protein